MGKLARGFKRIKFIRVDTINGRIFIPLDEKERIIDTSRLLYLNCTQKKQRRKRTKKAEKNEEEATQNISQTQDEPIFNSNLDYNDDNDESYFPWSFSDENMLDDDNNSSFENDLFTYL